MRWKASRYEFSFPRPALVMGIVNVTPDSFSDGGRFLDPTAAVAHGLDLVRQGADILDIGGESTRPGAAPVSEIEELRRVIPVLRNLASSTDVPLSIDTFKPAVAAAALNAGASIVNDVAAARHDPAMLELVGTRGAGYVAMHMQGTPATMQDNPSYEDVVDSVTHFFEQVLAESRLRGCSQDQIVLDVGIGFGKTLEHNLALLRSLERFGPLSRPLMLGVSRKSFLGQTTGASAQHRLPGALAASCLARLAGVQIFRTHDVAETVQALRMTDALRSPSPLP